MTDNTCTAMRAAMLDAEVDELRGDGDAAVARHVRSCDACRARAQQLLGSYAKLDSALAAMSTKTADAPVIRMPTRRRARWMPLPLAAAAVIALLLARQPADVLPNVDALAMMMTKEPPVASPLPGQQALVMEKDEMTIVWLYQQETP